MKKFSIIFPVMNQEDHIGKVMRDYHKALTDAGYSFEMIVVVNCTKDKSYEIGKKAAESLSDTSIYHLTGCGYGLGILHGIKHAKGENICYLNCARTDKEELVFCLKTFLSHPRMMVNAVRQKRDRLLRRLGALIFDGTCNLLFGLSSQDINGTIKIFSSEHAKKIHLHFTDSMIDLELLEKAKKLGIPVLEIPIFKTDRHGGRSTSNWKTIFRLMKEVLRYSILTRFIP